MRVRLVAAISCLSMTVALAPCARGAPDQAPTPCRMFIDRLSLPVPWLPTAVIVEGGDVRARWWGDAHSWPQLDPLPTDVRWRWEKILEVAAWPHASSYYLASRGGDLQCYVAVCGGFANDCRFSVPVLDEGAEPRYSAR